MSASPMLDFNNEFDKYMCNKDEEKECLLNRHLFLLLNDASLDKFDPKSPEMCKFYINIYTIVSIVDTNSDLMWSCVTVLEKSAKKNNECRKFLIDKIRIVPLFVQLLCTELKKPNLLNNSKIIKFLTFLQFFTYGIKISMSQDMYLINLIEILVKLIMEDWEKDVQTLSLSVLVNLCYKNPKALVLLLRSTNLYSFSHRIQSFGLQACQMHLILSNDTTLQSNFENFFIVIFDEILVAIRQLNVPSLKQISDFIVDATEHRHTKHIMGNYDFHPTIKVMLETMPQSYRNETEASKLIECMGFVLDILYAVLMSTNTSLKPLGAEILTFVKPFINNNEIGAKALNVARLLVLDNDVGKDLDINSWLEELIAQLNSSSIGIEMKQSILRFLIATVDHTEHVVDLITLPLFENILKRVVDEKNLDLFLSNDEIYLYLNCIYLFEECSKKNTILFPKLMKYYNHPAILSIIAKAMRSNHADTVFLVLKLTHSTHFPSLELSKTAVKSEIIGKHDEQLVPNVIHPEVSLREFINSQRINGSLEQRLDEVINAVTTKLKNNKDINTADLIALFEYKGKHSYQVERDFFAASAENSKLSQNLELLSLECRNLTELYYSTKINIDSLKTEYDILLQAHNEMKNTTITSQTAIYKYKKDLEQYKNLATGLENDHKELTEKYNSLLKEEKKYQAEVTKLTKQNTSIIKENEAFKESMKKADEKLTGLEQKLSANSKLKDRLKHDLTASESLVKQLEKQICEKNEKINSLENELQEEACLKSAIVTMMNKKQKK